MNKATDRKKRSPRRNSNAAIVWRRLLRNKTAMIGLIILVIITLVCLLADVFAPFGYDEQDVMSKFMGPGAEHWFGTDNLGRDIFSRILYGGRLTLVVGFGATGIAAVIGTVLGALAGYYGGKIDNVIMRILDVFMAVPNLVLAIALAAVMGTGIKSCMLAVGISAIPTFARTIRGPILAVKSEEYIEAAKSVDASDLRIIFKHVFLNVLSPVIVQLTLQIASAITNAAALSFLGLGIVPPTPEWGSMLSSARTYILKYPMLCVWPGLSIALVVLSLNLFGDGLRDALDPRLKD
ncbi:ABC transporter permease [Ruminococcus gauvreauii]|uniref:ABC transporter permease n=1 Tax=Ruminococcus gauvreauii TaxID=438033 RepID=A0ABY5VKG7_9FIRM|nr:ABC transporter permease [Ruminococcus gauvreauii]UWP61050.1 ABC transporter permease [Ruminococcus gauvreauii]